MVISPWEIARSAGPEIALFADTFAATLDVQRAVVYTFTLPANVTIFMAEIGATSAQDLDLHVSAPTPT